MQKPCAATFAKFFYNNWWESVLGSGGLRSWARLAIKSALYLDDPNDPSGFRTVLVRKEVQDGGGDKTHFR